MLTARALGHDLMDWSALVAGQRVSAGLEPFGKVSGSLHLCQGRSEANYTLHLLGGREAQIG